MAAHGFSYSGWQTVLWRDLFSAGGWLWASQFSAGADFDCRCVSREKWRCDGAGADGGESACPVGVIRRGWRTFFGERDWLDCEIGHRHVRREEWRLWQCAEVSSSLDAGFVD